MPILFPIDTFLNVPQTVQPVSFLSSYSSVQAVLRHTMGELWHRKVSETGFETSIECFLATCLGKTQRDMAASASVAAGELVDGQRVTGFTSTSAVPPYQAHQEPARTDQCHNSSFIWLCSFLSFNWVHVNWMSSNFFAVVLGHATLQWVLCISYLLLSFLVFLWRRQRLKIYYIKYIWLEKWHTRMKIHFYGNV